MRTSLHHPSRLTILSSFRKEYCGGMRWFYLCRCICGSEKEIVKRSVDSGLTRSCGCLYREVSIATAPRRNFKHGDGGVRRGVAAEYCIWRSMLKRCHLSTDPHYYNYGGRGITVCERWRTSYELFLADMGRKPTPRHTLDRWPNNDGNYEKANCRWATRTEQARNRRGNVLLTFDGKTQCVAAWAEEFGMERKKFEMRIRKGLNIEAAMVP